MPHPAMMIPTKILNQHQKKRKRTTKKGKAKSKAKSKGSKKKSSPKATARKPSKRARTSKGSSAAASENSPGTLNKKALPKKKKLTGAALDDLIVAYLQSTNRPHSEKEVHENNHKPNSLTQIKKALVKLAEKGQVCVKENGKYKVYFADQAQYSEYTADKVSAIEQEVVALKEGVKEVTENETKLRMTLKALQSRPRIDDLREQLAAATTELEQLEQRLGTIKEGAAEIDPQARKKLLKKGKAYLRLWRERRDIVRDFVDQVAEGQNKKPSQVHEMLDLEMDSGQSLDYKSAAKKLATI